MEITKEMIENRKQMLLEDRKQLLANLNATDGALQDCDFWIEQVSKQSE